LISPFASALQSHLLLNNSVIMHRFGLKLVALVGVANDYSTFVVAAGLISSESLQDLRWVIQQVRAARTHMQASCFFSLFFSS
jgi:hypothetical protein